MERWREREREREREHKHQFFLHLMLWRKKTNKQHTRTTASFFTDQAILSKQVKKLQFLALSEH